MNLFIIIILLLISYLLGSFPSGYILSKKLKNLDIREHGSKNTGATNTMRVLGFKFGLLAGILDLLKGIIIISILYIFKLENLYIITLQNREINIIGLYGIFAVLGHVFPIYLNFKGGKAVATSLGILLVLTPLIGLLTLLVFVIVVYFTKYVSLGSMLSATFAFLLSLTLSLITKNNEAIVPLYKTITIGILAFIIIVRHKDNIKRLLSKSENKIKS